MSFRSIADWCAKGLAVVGAVALAGSVGAEASSHEAALSQDSSLYVPQADVSVGYVVAGDFDSDGGGNPPKPE